MPLSFPSSPTAGQTYAYGGRTWVYQDGSWIGSRSLDTSLSVGMLTATAGETIKARQVVRMDSATGRLMRTHGALSDITLGMGLPPNHGTTASGQFNGNGAAMDIMCATPTTSSSVLNVTLFDKTGVETSRVHASINLGSAMVGYAAGTHLDGNYWAVVWYQSTTLLRGALMLYDPVTRTLSMVGSIVDQAVAVMANGKACFAYTNPVTGVAFCAVDTNTTGTLDFYALTRSGTTLVFTSIGKINPGMGVASIACAQHSGANTTILLSNSTSTTPHVGVVTINTSGTLSQSSLSTMSPFTLTFRASVTYITIHNSFVCVVGVYDGNGTTTNYTAGIAVGYISDSGGVTLRPVGISELNTAIPYVAAYEQHDTGGTVAYISSSSPRTVYALFKNNATGNLVRRRFMFDKNLNLLPDTAATILIASSLSGGPDRRLTFWTGRELYTNFASGTIPASFRHAGDGSSYGTILGIAANDASAGGAVQVYTAGTQVDGFTGLITGATYYTTPGGELTNIDLGSGLVSRVGVATSSTRLAVTL